MFPTVVKGRVDVCLGGWASRVWRACHDDVAARYVAQGDGSGEYPQLPGIEGLDSCPCRCRRRGALGEVGQGSWRRVGEIGTQGEQLGELLDRQAPQFAGNGDG